jgi:hypothetical protein
MHLNLLALAVSPGRGSSQPPTVSKGSPREGRPQRCREAALRERCRIHWVKVAALASTRRSRASMACRRIRALKRADEAVSVLRRKHRLRVGTGSGRLALRERRLPLCLEAVDPGRPRIREIARISVPHHERASTACRQTCAPRRAGGAVSVLRRVSVLQHRVRLPDGTGSVSREPPQDPGASLSPESRAVGTVSASLNVPARQATAEHGLAMLRHNPATAVL